MLHSLFLLALFTGCRKDVPLEDALLDEPFPLQLPEGFPYPQVHADNPLTLASVQLGKALFFDPRLSRTGDISCASCHLPGHAFSDTARLSTGVEDRSGMRNSTSLGNIGYHTSFFRDGGVVSLEQQVLSPIHEPVEMDHQIAAVVEQLKDVEPYRSLSLRAYGRVLDIWIITRAVANYERTLISGWSPYDRYLRSDAGALSEAAVRGWQIFSSPEAGCISCHSGFDLSDHSFHNIGLYADYADPGRARVSLNEADHGKFKVPGLRNVALTAPYMHDGSLRTLEEVVDHFASGGMDHPNKSPMMQPFTITPEQRADLVAFLHSLTDERGLDQVP
jgi:cytochrome c peroxidase